MDHDRENNSGNAGKKGQFGNDDGAQAASDMNPAASRGTDPLEETRPSQAEGDRETVSEDLEQHEQSGRS